MLRNDRYLDDALDLIAEASLNDALWDEVPPVVAELFGARTASLYFQDAQQVSGRLTMIETAVTVGYDASERESYANHYYALNPYHRRPELQVPGRIITEDMLPGELAPGEREYMEDWVRPQGVRHVMGEMLHLNGPVALSLVVWRGSAAGSFTTTEHAAFQHLSRAIRRAVRVSERLRTAEAEHAMASSVLHAQGVGVVALAADGRVRSVNAVAEAYLSASDGLTLRAGRLEALHVQDRPALRRLVDDLVHPMRFAHAEAGGIRLRRTGGRPDLVVEAVATTGRMARFRPDDAAAGLLVLRVPAPRTPSPGTLAQRWHLTPTEARLASLLLASLTLAEAAHRLGIGHETARTHLKALFSKTGTQRQAQLLVCLLTGL